MKNTGITRQIDHLGRIVVPKELRYAFNIQERTLLEIYLQDNSIILKTVKNTQKVRGIMRGVDELGRIVIPKEIRTSLNIMTNDLFDIFIDEQPSESAIVLTRTTALCVLCNSSEGLICFNGKNICRLCIAEIKAI